MPNEQNQQPNPTPKASSISIEVKNGRQGVNSVQIYREGTGFVVLADLTAKRADFISGIHDDCLRVIFNNTKETLHSLNLPNDSEITIKGFPLGMYCMCELGRYSFTAYILPGGWDKELIATWEKNYE